MQTKSPGKTFATLADAVCTVFKFCLFNSDVYCAEKKIGIVDEQCSALDKDQIKDNDNCIGSSYLSHDIPAIMPR